MVAATALRRHFVQRIDLVVDGSTRVEFRWIRWMLGAGQKTEMDVVDELNHLANAMVDRSDYQLNHQWSSRGSSLRKSPFATVVGATLSSMIVTAPSAGDNGAFPPSGLSASNW